MMIKYNWKLLHHTTENNLDRIIQFFVLHRDKALGEHVPKWAANAKVGVMNNYLLNLEGFLDWKTNKTIKYLYLQLASYRDYGKLMVYRECPVYLDNLTLSERGWLIYLQEVIAVDEEQNKLIFLLDNEGK